jgi:hypothetical protein
MESINENASRNYLRVDNNRVGTTRKAAKIKKPSLSDTRERRWKGRREDYNKKEYFQNQRHKFISFVYVLKDKNKSF